MHIFPGLGIVLQKGDKSVMELKPRDPKQKLVSTPQQIQILLRSVVVSIAVLYAVHHAASISKAESYVTTFGLTTLSLCLLFQAWSWLNVWTGGSKKHKREKIGFAMVANMIAAYALLFAAIYVKIIREILSTVSLSVGDLSYCAIIALLSWLLCVIVLKFSDTRFSCSR
jgi:magnesium-transporting ATPase (P-type)